MRNSDWRKSKFEDKFANLNINQQELDRMYRVHLREQEAMQGLAMPLFSPFGGPPTPESTTPAATGLLITSADFVQGSVFNSGTTTELGTNGVDGFTIASAGPNQMDEGYIGYDLTTALNDSINAAYLAAGIDPNNSEGYVWNATWGAGSTITTGLIKFGYQNSTPSSFYIQTIDPADPTWVNTGYDGTPLVGTFLFPLTITIYTPLTDKNNWC